MAHINYQSLRGKVFAYAPAEPAGNPHLWVILEAEGQKYFATINVRSNKDAPGDPIGKSYLYYFIDADYDHPIVPAILERPQGMSPVERSYRGRRARFSARQSLQPQRHAHAAAGGAGRRRAVHRLSAMLQLAKTQDCDVSSSTATPSPRTIRIRPTRRSAIRPNTPFGLDNVHMAQGDPRAINVRLHENGVWHDGACFIWDARARRMTAIFLAFQSQAWHTNDNGDLIYGATGCEAPLYDFSARAPFRPADPKRAAEITSAHRAPDGTRLGRRRQHERRAARPHAIGACSSTPSGSIPCPRRRWRPANPSRARCRRARSSDGGGLITLAQFRAICASTASPISAATRKPAGAPASPEGPLDPPARRLSSELPAVAPRKVLC